MMESWNSGTVEFWGKHFGIMERLERWVDGNAEKHKSGI